MEGQNKLVKTTRERRSPPLTLKLIEAEGGFQSFLYVVKREVKLTCPPDPGKKKEGATTCLLPLGSSSEKKNRWPPVAVWACPGILGRCHGA